MTDLVQIELVGGGSGDGELVEVFDPIPAEVSYGGWRYVTELANGRWLARLVPGSHRAT